MIDRLRRRAMQRGPLGGSHQWTIVWAVIVGVRLLRRLTASRSEVVFSQQIEPGETFLISGVGREPRIVEGR